MTKNDSVKEVIGRAELVDILDAGANSIPAKVDTGAYSCAVHADDIRLSEDGRTLHFRLFGGHPVAGAQSVEIATQDFTTAHISNSFGGKEQRFIVKMPIKLGTKTVKTHFSLADRHAKMFPILLGRRLLNGRFIVDTSQSRVNRVALHQEFGISFPDDEEEAHQ